IGEMKSKTQADELCDGLPSQFSKFLTYSKELQFTEKPDYCGIRNSFRRLLKSIEPDEAKWKVESIE
ncbi:casein kinase, putative, partial [Entamoeba invadens IP1]